MLRPEPRGRHRGMRTDRGLDEGAGVVTVTVTTQPVAFSWPAATRARIYFIQPLESGLTTSAPFTHRPSDDDRAWPSLIAALEADTADPWSGPVIFVVPELTIDASHVESLRARWASMSPNRLLVGGLGHLTAAQCDEVEPSTVTNGSLWERPADPDRYANAAIVLPGPFLEAKNSPSKWERDHSCHRAHARLRVFEGDGFRFVVLICSEMNDAGARNDLLEALSPHNLDAVFWLQHNPAPRHQDFQGLVEGILDRHSKAIIVCANKSSAKGRGDGAYGASGFLLRANRMERDKRFLARPNIAIEGVSDEVTRAILPQYSAAVHWVDTIRPAAVGTGTTDSARNRLLETACAYDLTNARIQSRPDGHHVVELVATGEREAAERSCLESSMLGSLATRQDLIVQWFARAANDLFLFLDHALRRLTPAHTHEPALPHSPAAACRCWIHRENFDSLFAPKPSAGVAELVLAVAAMPTATPVFKRRTNVSVDVAGTNRDLLVAWGEDRTSDDFEREYGGPNRAEFVPRPAIVLDCRRKQLTVIDASRPAPDLVDAASASEPMLRRLYGAEFWASVRSGTIDRAVSSLFP